MKYDVFISYSSLDQKVAEGVCAYLEQHRIRCFIAYRDIPKGTVWARAIVEALDESRMMVIVFSDNFNRSEQVDREIELASEDRKPILTFRIADDAFRGAKKYYLKNLNWIDAFPQPERCFGELCENVKRLLGIKEEEDNTRQEEEKEEKVIAVPISHVHFGLSTEQHYQNGLEAAERRDYYNAIDWFTGAAEQGHIAAQNRLGDHYYKGIGATKDYAQAIYWYQKAAVQGNIEAQFKLGYCYKYNTGTTQNYTKAIKWFRKLAEQDNDMAAQFELGDCYYNGIGVTKDYIQALYWYRKAAAQGDIMAQDALTSLGETW